MNKNISFLIEGVKNLKEVGAFTRSGPTLCKKMIQRVASDKDVIVLELGAGDGVITKHLLERVSPNSKIISIELNEKLYPELSSIKDDRLIAINDNIENLDAILKEQGIKQVDYMISAIPFALLPKEQVKAFLNKHKGCIKPGGCYVQLHYASNLLKFYRKIFGNAKLNFVLANVPPAFVFECEI